MKRMWLGLGLMLTASSMYGQVTPEEMLGAVDKMSPQQAYDFTQKLEAKQWKPVPEGFFSRMAVDISLTGAGLDDPGISGLTLSGDDLNPEDASGLDIGLFWRVFDPRLRLGLRLGSWEATDSDLAPAGYSRVDLVGASLTIAANVQVVRKPRWLVWIEAAPGIGAVELEAINTPTGEATTQRTLEGGYGIFDLQTGISWRLNPILTLFAAGGYRFAEDIQLEEGGDETDLDFNGSGGTGRFGLGVNF